MDRLNKYIDDNGVNEILDVNYTGGSSATVSLWVKEDRKWRSILECKAFVGRNGIDKVCEGDGKTPTGDFGIITAFGLKPNPGTDLPYIDIDDNLWCCGDEVAYNKMIDIRVHPHECKGEHMSEYVPAYHYGIFPDYNKECVWNAGSAVFIHCFGKHEYTSGCVAVSEDDMAFILRHLHSGARIIIG